MRTGISLHYILNFYSIVFLQIELVETICKSAIGINLNVQKYKFLDKNNFNNNIK